MSYLTEYIDEYREHSIKKTKICAPEDRWAKVEGKWLDPKGGTEDKTLTDEEIERFIKMTMMSLRGQSTYYNDYCARFPPEFKTRAFQPREKRKPCTKTGEVVEEAIAPTEVKLAIKDTELMKVARDLYERDLDKPTLEPLPTHFRTLGYVRPRIFKTGVSEYQESIARLAYEMIRDDRIPPYHSHNGCRPRWGLPPEGVRQPDLDVIPLDGERLY